MLNRRLLRIKVMQSLYAFFQSDNTDISKGEKSLLLSIDRVYELYLLYLSLPIELANIAELQMEEARNKILPTAEEKNPNKRFVDNEVITSLKNNPVLHQKLESKKLSWAPYYDALKLLWKKIKDSDIYLNYLKEAGDINHDRVFLEQLIKTYILDNEDLYGLIQENSIFWDFEDNDFAITMAMRYFNKIKSAEKYKPLPEKFKDEVEDLQFVKDLFRKTITHQKENKSLIEGKTENWEIERIAMLDVLFMEMAITEFLYFSSIPVKVTLNEYIEMAKFFSTPKSKVFINGVLDKLLGEFKKEERLNKIGRGLMQ